MKCVTPQKLFQRISAARIKEVLVLRAVSIHGTVFGGVFVECGFWKRARLIDHLVEEAMSVKLKDSGVVTGFAKVVGHIYKTSVPSFSCDSKGRVPVGCSLYWRRVHE